MSESRAMWRLFEPIHAITYFAPHSRERFAAAGLRGFWRGYFAGRAATLGPVSAAPVIASFFSFAPAMVHRAIPEVWTMVSPEGALRARVEGAVATLATLLADLPGDHVAEAADLLTRATGTLDPAGHVLGAANAALPPHAEPLARLWQAATTLREHRGDGHIAALVAAGIGACEVLVLRGGMDLSREIVQPARGWTDEEWTNAQARLVARGWLDADGRATSDGVAGFRAAETATDLAAASPWLALGPQAVRRLENLLTPMAAACYAVLPAGNPIGLPAPPASSTNQGSAKG